MATTVDVSKAHFLLEGEHLEWKDLMVADFVGREAISQPFRFDLRLISYDASFPFDDVMNKAAVLTMVRDDVEVKRHGVIVDFSQGGFADRERIFYHAVLVPRLWLLSLTYQSRVYQNMTVQDIVTDVLKKSGFASDDYKWSLKGAPAEREYVVQYRETDLDFVSRLLEHEGIFYTFDQTGDKEVLTLSDDRTKFPALEAPDEVPFRAPGGLASKAPEHVNGFALRQRVVTGKVMLRDYNYRTPELNLQSQSQLNQNGVAGVYYDYGDHFKNVNEGNALARIRNEEIECTRVVGRGRADVRGFGAGTRFTMSEHFRDDWNQEWLLTEVEHQGSQLESLGLGKDTGAPIYRNDFTCIPASAPYRPPRITPAPRMPGIWTAKIESSGGPYAHLDDQGRYKVRMPFDVSGSDKAAGSRYVRMAQPYAGPGYGFHAPCHEGVEMVLACIDGNVDRPLGLSVAPNPSQMTPSTSRNKSQTVFRTASGNEFSMDDAGGAQMMFVNASKDMSTVVANDQTIEVTNDRKVSIGVNLDESVGGNQSVSITGNLTENIKGNEDFTIMGNVTETITGNHSATITGNVTETVAGNSTETVAGSKTITSGAAMAITSAALSMTCAALTLSAGGGMSVSAKGDSKENSSGSKKVQVGSGYTLQAGGAVAMKGVSIKQEGATKVEIKGAQISIEAQGVLELKAGGSSIQMTPGSVIIKSAGLLQIQGAVVMIN